MSLALHPRSSAKIRDWWFVVALATLGACDRAGSLGDRGFHSPRDAYVRTLEKAGLDRTALGRDWVAAGDAALLAATRVSVPHREALHLPATTDAGCSWRPMRNAKGG